MRIHTLITCSLILAAAAQLHAQEPLPPGAKSAVSATVGNNVLQVRYLTESPISGMKGDLDYGALLTEGREFILSSALMFDTNVDSFLPAMRVEVGPQGYVALLQGRQKTDVFAVAVGANARYEFIRSIGLAAIGSAFYSPGVLTFGSAHNLYDFIVGAEVKAAPQLGVLAGYRWLKFTLVNQPDDKVVNEVFAGIRWQLK